MEKITLYVGLNDKDTKAQKIDTLEAVKITKNLGKPLTNRIKTAIYNIDVLRTACAHSAKIRDNQKTLFIL